MVLPSLIVVVAAVGASVARRSCGRGSMDGCAVGSVLSTVDDDGVLCMPSLAMNFVSLSEALGRRNWECGGTGGGREGEGTESYKKS
jgi:hypothetical protein